MSRNILPGRLAAVLLPTLLTTPSFALEGHPAKAASAPKTSRTSADYADRLKRVMAWPAFPVRIRFVHDLNYTSARERAARQGFDRWVEATGRFVSYTVEDAPERAQVTVRFDPESNNGYTATRFTERCITGATMTVGVERCWPDDIAAIAAHEFGHALGLDGHSDNTQDLMYPIHMMGTAWRITPRDVHTLRGLYPGLDDGRIGKAGERVPGVGGPER